MVLAPGKRSATSRRSLPEPFAAKHSMALGTKQPIPPAPIRPIRSVVAVFKAASFRVIGFSDRVMSLIVKLYKGRSPAIIPLMAATLIPKGGINTLATAVEMIRDSHSARNDKSTHSVMRVFRGSVFSVQAGDFRIRIS